MKEAAGEANMTVVTIILIGVVVAIATPLITKLMTSTQKRSECINDGGTWVDGQCDKLTTH
jgi:putative effector of murein hydrolase